MGENELAPRVAMLARALRARGHRLALAESCTGGWCAKLCTDLPGSSDWFECGLVTYSNAAKTRLLGVPATLIERHGAVSAEVAKAMAAGALACSEATWAAAVTGVAGPDGGSADKPVGTVWCAWAGPGLAPQAKAFALPGNRSQVRGASAAAVIDGLLARLGS